MLGITMMAMGNKLVLGIEDIIHHVANRFGNWGTHGSGKSKNHEEKVIRNKCLSVKLLFDQFQDEVKSKGIYIRNKENEVFNILEEYYINELIANSLIGSDVNKLIDEAHHICNKLRKLLIYLDENKNS